MGNVLMTKKSTIPVSDPTSDLECGLACNKDQTATSMSGSSHWWSLFLGMLGFSQSNEQVKKPRGAWLCPEEEDPYQVITIEPSFQLVDQECKLFIDQDWDETASCGTELIDPLEDEDDVLLTSDCSFVSADDEEALQEEDFVSAKDEVGEVKEVPPQPKTECEQDLERLVYMTTCSRMNSVRLQDYMCLCGNCPSLRRIVKHVQSLDDFQATVDTDKALVRLLVAFSVYDENQMFHRDMISCARHCLSLWSGDEEKAFRSFVILYDDALYAQMTALQL